ncbi:MAG: argininosuccinate lyase [Lentisphaeria bacterium]|nr:argininosuccinate lyase [Lentisphaeria bacterium]
MALWSGRFSKDTDAAMARFSESVSYDWRLYEQDIAGSVAHADMLAAAGIISADDARKIVTGLEEIGQEIRSGEFTFKPALEDVHMNIESALIERLGPVGARLHTGRSRNDQVNTDERLWLRKECGILQEHVSELQKALVFLGDANRSAIMPGFTHLQHAQPVLFAHHLLAYVEMFERDKGRLADAVKRFNVSPLGSGALAGSTLPLNREWVAEKLGFDGVTQNSMDAVGDRDFVAEVLAALAITAVHCSRLAEDCVLWMSQEFNFVVFDDAFCTGSSLMPQKKNPDAAELTRGKTGRVIGALMGILTTMKGLPLTYNRDLQEDKEGLFDAVDTVKLVLSILAPMTGTARVNADAMLKAASDPALMATDLAEWLVRRGVPFREAHHQVGAFVGDCERHGRALNEATLEQMRETIPLAEPDCLTLFNPEKSVAGREITGATGPEQVGRQLDRWIKLFETGCS